MIIEATNIIEVLAVHGQAHGLELPISSLIGALLDTSGCVSYSAVQSPANNDLWVITGHWDSIYAMESHYSHPALNDLIKVLGGHAVNRIAVSSFMTVRV